VVIVAGAYFAGRPTVPPVTVVTTTVSPVTVVTTIVSPVTAPTIVPRAPETLIIDEARWPDHNLNALYAVQFNIYPHWQEHTVYQTLVVPNVVAEFREGKLEFVPDLSTDWTISSDFKAYTYNLRQGVKFSNGDPFNAYQVWTQMYAWYYLNANGTNFLSGLDLFDTSHVKFGPASFELLKSSGLANPSAEALAMMEDKTWPIYTNGPYQIVFQLKIPFLFLNGLLVGYQGLLFDCQWILDNGGFGTPAQFNPYFDDHPIPGTGPYMVTEVVLNSHVKFEKNPNYWGAKLTPEQIAANPILNPGSVKTVIMRTVADDLARFTDLSTGAAHMAAIKRSNWNMVINEPEYAYWSVESSAYLIALTLNTAIPPTNNVNLRRAIAHAINYKDIWEKVFFGQVGPLVGPATPNYGIYYNSANLPPYDYNVEKAKDFLAKAGYPNGQGLPTLTLRIISGCLSCTTGAEIIQSNLSEIGINVIVTALPASVYWTPFGDYSTNLKNAKELGHMSFLGGWFGYAPDYLAPTNYWSNFVTSRSLWGNFAAYKNPTVDHAVSVLASSGNADEIVAALKAAQQQIYDDVPYAWIGTAKLWFGDGSFVWRKALIKEVWFDPSYGGINDAPLFNTVVFA